MSKHDHSNRYEHNFSTLFLISIGLSSHTIRESRSKIGTVEFCKPLNRMFLLLFKVNDFKSCLSIRVQISLLIISEFSYTLNPQRLLVVMTFFMPLSL